MVVRMLDGEQVVVLRPSKTDGGGKYNAQIVKWSDEPVSGVLLGAATPADVQDSTLPNALSVDLTAYFPRGYDKPLRGCRIRARDRVWQVVGDPIPFDGGIKPTKWNLAVNLHRTDGR